MFLPSCVLLCGLGVSVVEECGFLLPDQVEDKLRRNDKIGIDVPLRFPVSSAILGVPRLREGKPSR
jgi:hypothetical protein